MKLFNDDVELNEHAANARIFRNVCTMVVMSLMVIASCSVIQTRSNNVAQIELAKHRVDLLKAGYSEMEVSCLLDSDTVTWQHCNEYRQNGLMGKKDKVVDEKPVVGPTVGESVKTPETTKPIEDNGVVHYR